MTRGEAPPPRLPQEQRGHVLAPLSAGAGTRNMKHVIYVCVCVCVCVCKKCHACIDTYIFIYIDANICMNNTHTHTDGGKGAATRHTCA